MDSTIKKIVSFAVTTAFSIIQANCQNNFHSLEEVWSYALSNSKENTVYDLQHEKSQNEKKIANSFLYPKVNIGVTGQRNGAIPQTPVPGELVGMPGETVFLQFGQTYTYTSGISINKTLFDWQSRLQAQIAQSNIKLVKAEKDYFNQNLKQQVAQVYYAVITSKAAVELSAKDLELSDSTLQLTTNRLEQGLTDVITLNNAKINKNNALDRYQQNKQYLFEYEANLKILLGLASDDTIILSEQIQFEDNIALDAISYDKLTLNLYQIQAESASLATKQAFSRYLPKLDAYTYLGGIQYQQDFKYTLQSSDWQPNRYIGLNLYIPLFTGFANRNQYQSAKISENIAKLNYDEVARKSSLNDKILFNNYISTKLLVQSTDQTLKLADENVQLALKKYSEGLLSLDNYLSVYDDYLAVENQYFSRLSDYFISKAIIQARSN